MVPRYIPKGAPDWWRISLCCALMTMGCGGGGPSQPSRVVAYTDLLGGWELEVRDTAACAGLSGPVAVMLTISQQSGEANRCFLFLNGGTSHWSASGYGAGYVTGILPLCLPGNALVNLNVGNEPPPPGSPAAVAQFMGTLTEDLELRGVLTDPAPALAPPTVPIFSSQPCAFQVHGGHP